MAGCAVVSFSIRDDQVEPFVDLPSQATLLLTAVHAAPLQVGRSWAAHGFCSELTVQLSTSNSQHASALQHLLSEELERAGISDRHHRTS